MSTISANNHQADTASPLTVFIGVATAVLLLRVIALWFNTSELFFDEAQYWLWGKEPAFGYFSKPPLLGWILAFSTGICGNSEFCVRLISPILHTITALLIFACGKTLFDARTGLVAGVTWLLLPAVSLSSTLISTDVPLLLCWAAALYALIRYLETPAVRWLAVLAIAFGLGLNAKYAMAYFVLCFVVWVVFTARGRRSLADWRLWFAFAVGFAFLAPNLVWQVENQFTTVSHTGENIGWQGAFPNLSGLGEFLGSQFGVAGPIVFGVYCVALFRLWREGLTDKQAMLIAFSLPVVLVISFQAIMSKAFANWAATAIPAMVLLVANLFVSRMPSTWYRLSNGIHAVVFAVLLVLPAFALPGQLPVERDANPFARMWGGREPAAEIARIAEVQGAQYVLTAGRQQSAVLTYYLWDETDLETLTVRGDGPPRDHYQLTRAIEDRPASQFADAIFLHPARSTQLSKEIRALFTRATVVGEISRGDGTERTYTVFRLEGYRGG